MRLRGEDSGGVDGVENSAHHADAGENARLLRPRDAESLRVGRYRQVGGQVAAGRVFQQRKLDERLRKRGRFNSKTHGAPAFLMRSADGEARKR